MRSELYKNIYSAPAPKNKEATGALLSTQVVPIKQELYEMMHAEASHS